MSTNIWSLQFCRDVFVQVATPADPAVPKYKWERGSSYFHNIVRNKISPGVKITRKIGLQDGTDISSILFVVDSMPNEGGHPRYFFMHFDKVAGLGIVNVLRVYKPKGDETGHGYEQTMMYSQIFVTPQALARTDIENNTPFLLGRDGLAKLLLERQPGDPELYHSGDCEYYGDVRNLVGVIKWYPSTFRNEQELPSEYFDLYPQADAIRLGPEFSQRLPV